jgi:hypothetical protein
MGKRLYSGDYVARDDRTQAHRAFFLSIQDHAPEVLKALWQDVLPVARQIVMTPAFPFNQDLVSAIYNWARTFHLVTSMNPVDELIRPLEEVRDPHGFELESGSLQACYPDWQFFFAWIWAAAFKTLKKWKNSNKKPARLEWNLPHRDLRSDGDPEYPRKVEAAISEHESRLNQPSSLTCSFECRDWNPCAETLAAARKRMKQEVSLQIEKKVEATRKLFDYVTPLINDVAPKAMAVEHFDWLVKYQLQGIPYGRIGKQGATKRGQQTIADGVKHAAELVIGPKFSEWLRPGRPGRPRKA